MAYPEPPPFDRYSGSRPQPYPQPYAPRREDTGMAMASMILGILSFFGLAIFTSIPAVVLGHVVISQIRRGELSDRARGMAMAGLVLGYVNIALMAVGFFMILAFFVFSFGMLHSMMPPPPSF